MGLGGHDPGFRRHHLPDDLRAFRAEPVNHLANRLAERQLEFVISDSALDLLGEAGFDPVYGARPLKREIQQQIENPLAQLILGGKFINGDTVFVDASDGKIVFGSDEAIAADADEDTGSGPGLAVIH